jgi:hypothetical protein
MHTTSSFRAYFMTSLVASLTACATGLDAGSSESVANPDLGAACQYVDVPGSCTLADTRDDGLVDIQFTPDDPHALEQTTYASLLDRPQAVHRPCAAAVFNDAGDTVPCLAHLISVGTCQPWTFLYPAVCP